jgi:hypothetical protein
LQGKKYDLDRHRTTSFKRQLIKNKWSLFGWEKILPSLSNL